jgi:hypothetical protein
VADRAGFHYSDIKSYSGPGVRASPHLSLGVPVRGALLANIVAPYSARASGEAHLQSEEIVERLHDTVMPTIGPTGSAAEEVSASQDALAYSVLFWFCARLARIARGLCCLHIVDSPDRAVLPALRISVVLVAVAH